MKKILLTAVAVMFFGSFVASAQYGNKAEADKTCQEYGYKKANLGTPNDHHFYRDDTSSNEQRNHNQGSSWQGGGEYKSKGLAKKIVGEIEGKGSYNSSREDRTSTSTSSGSGRMYYKCD